MQLYGFTATTQHFVACDFMQHESMHVFILRVNFDWLLINLQSWSRTAPRCHGICPFPRNFYVFTEFCGIWYWPVIGGQIRHILMELIFTPRVLRS